MSKLQDELFFISKIDIHMSSSCVTYDFHSLSVDQIDEVVNALLKDSSSLDATEVSDVRFGGKTDGLGGILTPCR